MKHRQVGEMQGDLAKVLEQPTFLSVVCSITTIERTCCLKHGLFTIQN